MQYIKTVWDHVRTTWQAYVFAAVGFFALYHVYLLLQSGRVTEAGAVFGIAFLSFLYANLSRFKRFKGLGFEAELWEDKQREAADLIERLKTVVSIYTREVVMSKVMAGRFSDGSNWKDNWKLYDDLVTQHDILGQKIDFSALKADIDRVFLFDMVIPQLESISASIEKGRQAASEVIEKEFPPPIKDVTAYSVRVRQNDVQSRIDDPLKLSKTENLPNAVLRLADEAAFKLDRDFGVKVTYDEAAINRLRTLAKLYGRPVKLTDEVMKWANRRG